jgi:type VI secretion system secreted protein Hcp
MKRSGFKGLVAAGLVATGLASSTSVVSASDMFLKISGIKGESTEAGHKDSIDVLAWSWGTSTGTGKVKRGTVPPQCIQDLSLTKYVDQSTPQLIMLGVMGQTAKEATLSVRKSGDKQQEYLILKMTDVMVTSYQTGGAAGSNAPLMDQLVLNFSSIEGEYRRQRADGSLESPVVFQVSGSCPD